MKLEKDYEKYIVKKFISNMEEFTNNLKLRGFNLFSEKGYIQIPVNILAYPPLKDKYTLEELINFKANSNLNEIDNLHLFKNKWDAIAWITLEKYLNKEYDFDFKKNSTQLSLKIN